MKKAYGVISFSTDFWSSTFLHSLGRFPALKIRLDLYRNRGCIAIGMPDDFQVGISGGVSKYSVQLLIGIYRAGAAFIYALEWSQALDRKIKVG